MRGGGGGGKGEILLRGHFQNLDFFGGGGEGVIFRQGSIT